MRTPPLLTINPTTLPQLLEKEAQALSELAYAHVKTAGLATTSYALQGMFYVSASGWGLLNVPNSLVRGAFDALHEPGAQLPPSKGKILNGHCSVLSKKEVEQLGGPDKIAERGHFYRYTLGPLKTVEPSGWPEVSRVWFIEIRSPELEKLRKSYGLRPLLNGHPFHLTVAVRKKNVLRDNAVSKTASACVPRAVQEAVDALSEKEWDGLMLLYHPGPPARAHLDVMDWGDSDIGKKLGKVLEKECGKDHVEYVNEGRKPEGTGWVSVHPAWSKKGEASDTHTVTIERTQKSETRIRIPRVLTELLARHLGKDKEKAAAHLAHIGGVSGGGKTRLLEALAAHHPQLVAKDVDEFDEQAKDELGMKWTAGGTSTSDAQLAQLTRRKQDLLDHFLAQHHDHPVVTGGIHFENGPTHVLKLPESMKLMLDTSPLKGSWRAYWRSRRASPDNPYTFREAARHWRDNRHIYQDYQGMGFQPVSAADARQRIDAALARTKEAAARWRQVLRAHPESAAAQKIIERLNVERVKPQLLDPVLRKLKRPATLAEFMRSIPAGVRVDRPYADWAQAVAQHPELAKIQPTKMLGLGADALALQTRQGDVLKLSTLPFGRTRWDIPTQDLGTVPVPVHPKARKGILYAGRQPLADVNETKANLTRTAQLYTDIHRSGYYIPDDKLENIGHVGGRAYLIDNSSALPRPDWVTHQSGVEALLGGKPDTATAQYTVRSSRRASRLPKLPGAVQPPRPPSVVPPPVVPPLAPVAESTGRTSKRPWSLSALLTRYFGKAGEEQTSAGGSGYAAPAALATLGLGSAYALHRLRSVPPPEEPASSKVAAVQHHVPVVEAMRRDGKSEKICPHCGQPIAADEIYTDAKGWTFHRPCFQKGKGAIKLAASVTLRKGALVPHKEQGRSYTCGPAALRTVLDAFGPDVSEATLNRQMEAHPDKGTPPHRLLQAAQERGLKVHAQEDMNLTHLKQLTESGKPVVVAMQAHGGPDDDRGWKNGHYVVVTEVDDQNVHYRDPANRDSDTTMPLQGFLDHWHDQEAGGRKYRRLGIAMWDDAEKTGTDARLEECLRPFDPGEFELPEEVV